MATYKTPVFITKCAIFYTTMGLTSFMVKLQVIYDNIANIAWNIFIVTEIIVCWPLFQFYLCHLLSFKLLFACLRMQWNIFFLALYVVQSIISNVFTSYLCKLFSSTALFSNWMAYNNSSCCFWHIFLSENAFFFIEYLLAVCLFAGVAKRTYRRDIEWWLSHLLHWKYIYDFFF